MNARGTWLVNTSRITLPKILDSLLNLTEEVTIDPAIADRARASVERMIALGR